MMEQEPGANGTRAPSRLSGYLCAGLVIALFTGFVLVSRLGLSLALALPDIALLRFSISGVLLAPVLVRRGLGGLRLIDAIGLACIGGLAFGLLAFSGIALAPASHGSILIHGTLPLTTALLLGKRERRAPRIALLAIGAGVAALALGGGTQASPSLLLGDACLLAASLCWAAFGLRVRALGLAPLHAAAVVACLSGLMFLPLFGLFPHSRLLEASWRDILLQGLVQGVLVATFSPFLYARAVAGLGPERVATLIALVPVLTTLGGLWLLDEDPTPTTMAGLVLVTGGMIMGGLMIGARRRR